MYEPLENNPCSTVKKAFRIANCRCLVTPQLHARMPQKASAETCSIRRCWQENALFKQHWLLILPPNRVWAIRYRMYVFSWYEFWRIRRKAKDFFCLNSWSNLKVVLESWQKRCFQERQTKINFYSNRQFLFNFQFSINFQSPSTFPNTYDVTTKSEFLYI